MINPDVHRLVPDFILRHFSQGTFNGRMDVVSLFVDISGFSDLTNTLMEQGQGGAETLAIIMRSVMDPMIQAVYEQNGFVASIAGDALTALFPMDEPGGDAPWRAIAVALKIQKIAHETPKFTAGKQAFQISVKVGLGAGAVQWGIITSSDGKQAIYYFQGEAVENCAEAEHQAEAGSVIVHPTLLEKVHHHLRFEPIGSYGRIVESLAPVPPTKPLQVSPLDPKMLAQFFPESLVTQTLVGEFRQVLNLFINLPTIRTETQLRIFIESLFVLQVKYGGLINRLDFGDKGSNLLLFWGAPIAYENDVERALNFILELQAVTSIPITAGITYRMAHAGFVGGAMHEDYTCYGGGINLAARFMTSAARGEIWVDEPVAQKVRSQFELELTGSMIFKGFSQPQQVYILLERKEPSVIGQQFQGQMVGRQEELSALERLINPVFEGRYAGLIVVVGEAGVGKSRFVHEFMEAALFLNQRAQWALGQTDEILRQSLNPFRYWLRSYFKTSVNQGEARNKRQFNVKLDELIQVTTNAALTDELDKTRSFLGALVDLHWPDSLYEQYDAKGRFENTLLGLEVLLKAESLRAPLVLLLEDIQWLDKESIQFLSRLNARLSAGDSHAYPLAILATSRGMPNNDFLSNGTYQQISLAGLSAGDMHQIVGHYLSAVPSENLLDLLFKRSEGNPFFAEQILQYLQEQDLLENSEAGVRIRSSAIDLLPAGINGLLVARLDLLAREIKDVVQTAAVLGREFEVRMLAQILQDSRLPEKVTIAQQESIWFSLNEIRYIFKHALLRDAAYHMQVRSRLQNLHHLAASAFEVLYSYNLEPHYGEIAYHYEQADLPEPARRYLKLAGETAEGAYQNQQAAEYYTRALAVWPDEDLAGQFDLLEKRVKLDDVLAQRTSQKENIDRLMELVGLVEKRSFIESEKKLFKARVLIKLSDYYERTGGYPDSILYGKQAVDLAQESYDAEVEARAYLSWGAGLWRSGEFSPALQPFEKGLAIARKTGLTAIEADCLFQLGIVNDNMGLYDQALEYLQRALEIFRQLGDLSRQAMVLNSIGANLNTQGFQSRALGNFEESLALKRKVGNRRSEMITQFNIASTYFMFGQYAVSRLQLEWVLAFFQETGDLAWQSVTLGQLGELFYRVGDYSTADAYLEQSIKAGGESGDRMTVCLSTIARGLTYDHLKRELEAVEYFDRAYKMAEEMEALREKAMAWHHKAHTLLSMKRYAEAFDLFITTRAMWDEMSNKKQNIEATAGLARVAVFLQKPPEAVRALVEEVLAYFGESVLQPGESAHASSLSFMYGMETFFHMLLNTCYTLQALGDPRFQAFLSFSQTMLKMAADQVGDEDMKQSFMENVNVHRELAALS